MATIALSYQDTTVFFPTSCSSVPRKRGRRPSRKSMFRGNQHPTVSLDKSSGTLPLQTTKAKLFQFMRPRRGYISRNPTPFP